MLPQHNYHLSSKFYGSFRSSGVLYRDPIIMVFKRSMTRSAVGRFCGTITKLGQTRTNGVLPSITQHSIPSNTTSGVRSLATNAKHVDIEAVKKDLPPADKHPSQYSIEEKSAMRAQEIYNQTTKITKKGKKIAHASTVYEDPKGNTVIPLGSETHSKKVNGLSTLPAPQSLGQANPKYKNSYFNSNKVHDYLCGHHFTDKNDLTGTGTIEETDLHNTFKFEPPAVKDNIPNEDDF